MKKQVLGRIIFAHLWFLLVFVSDSSNKPCSPISVEICLKGEISTPTRTKGIDFDAKVSGSTGIWSLLLQNVPVKLVRKEARD